MAMAGICAIVIYLRGIVVPRYVPVTWYLLMLPAWLQKVKEKKKEKKEKSYVA